MLPAALRLRRSADLVQAVRRGARAGRPTLVVHCLPVGGASTRVGFVVSRAVGGAVVRNRVRRRLRGVVVEHRSALPQGMDVVVRALPAAADADYPDLAEALISALRTASRRAAGSRS